jgi:hypothetical protein
MITLVRAAQAVPVDQLMQGYFEPAEQTIDGVACAGCSTLARRAGDRTQVRHASVAHVRYCFGMRAAMAAEAQSEHEAERSVERFFEEGRGIYEPDPPSRFGF